MPRVRASYVLGIAAMFASNLATRHKSEGGIAPVMPRAA